MPEAIALDPRMQERFESLHRLVGNTPLLAVELTYRGQPRVIYAKQESLNLTGSIKDRMALHIVHRAYREGRLKPGDRIAEATSGNTGISFAAIGRALGHPVTVFMPDWMSEERKALLASFGETFHWSMRAHRLSLGTRVPFVSISMHRLGGKSSHKSASFSCWIKGSPPVITRRLSPAASIRVAMVSIERVVTSAL